MRAHLCHHRAEADAGEDEDVVGLADEPLAALPGQRPEGAAGGDEGATLAPGEDVRRGRLDPARGVGQGEDDGPFDALGHGPDDRLRRTSPSWPVVPMSTSGRMARMTSARWLVVVSLETQPMRVTASSAHRELALELVEVRAAGVDQAARVEHGDPRVRLGTAHAFLGEGAVQQPDDADAGRAGASQHEAQVGQATLQGAGGRVEAGQDDRGRALHVVVEAGHLVAEVVEDAQGVGALEVLPLDDAAGPDLLDAAHEGLHQLVVGMAPQAPGAIPEVERVGQELAVVRAHVERDRQRQRGVQRRSWPSRAPACRRGCPCRRHPGRPRPRMRSLSVTTMSRTSG